MMPCNLAIKNMLEMLQKMSEEVELDSECDLSGFTLLSQATVRMAHCQGDDGH